MHGIRGAVTRQCTGYNDLTRILPAIGSESGWGAGTIIRSIRNTCSIHLESTPASARPVRGRACAFARGVKARNRRSNGRRHDAYTRITGKTSEQQARVSGETPEWQAGPRIARRRDRSEEAAARAAVGARRRLLRAAARATRPGSPARSPTPSTRSSRRTSASPRARARRPEVGKEGKTRHRITIDRRSGAWGEMESSVNTLIDDLLWPTTRSDAHDRGRREGRSVADDAARSRRPAAEGRVPALRDDRQHDDRADERVHLRSDARGARSRHRGQARRPGAGARRRRHLERPDRQRQLDGRQPDRPGAQHRRGRRSPSRTATCRARSRSTCAAKSCS